MVLAERGQIHVQVYKNSAKEQVTVMVATFPGNSRYGAPDGEPGRGILLLEQEGVDG